MHGIKSFQLGLNLYKVGMNSFHPFPTHCLVLIKTSPELLWVHLYKKFFLEQVGFIIFDFLRIFLIFNSAKLQFIQEWIHSRMESIHTNYEPNHSNNE